MASCSSVKEGVVVSKSVRMGMASACADGFLRSGREPDVYWVEVEGRNQHGRVIRQSVLLFRNDWSLIKVGDHWRCGKPVTPSKSCTGK